MSAERYWEARWRDEAAENDQLRGVLKAFVSEFDDYHYEGCPADIGGKCDCYPGALIWRARKVLGGESVESDRPTIENADGTTIS